MSNYEPSTYLAFLPMALIVYIVAKHYISFTPKTDEIDKKASNNEEFIVPNAFNIENKFEISNEFEYKFKMKRVDVKDINSIQNLTKYNKGTYRDLLGRFKSINNE